MQRFTDLEVWRLGHQLTQEEYRITGAFPREELFGLTSQLRRASSSVPINIAEGSKRTSNKDYARFLNISEGSLAETEYELMLARDLKYSSADEIAPLLERCGLLARKLHNLRKKEEGKP
ncbi:MAG: four helix bundle protein [Planctomycetes bacterium]|nr:four helix bundle protein [Planctomycetota bacterium]